MFKKFYLLFLLVFLTLISGCTQLLWVLNNPNERDVHTIVEAYTDEIQSVFEYNNVRMSTQSSTGQQEKIDLPTKGIGFIGEKNIYFVTLNGDVLLSLNSLMKTIPFTSFTNNKYLEFYLKYDYVGFGNGAFHQFIKVKTQKPASLLTAQEEATLVKSAFTKQEGYYFRTIEIEGIVIDKKRFGGAIIGEASLGDNYHVRFLTQRIGSNFNSGKLAFNVIMTPVTVVGDILLIPLFLLSN